MKKYLWTIFIFLISINSLSAGESLKISAPPSIWVQKQGETLTGPIVELLKETFDEFDVMITPVTLPWTRSIEHMKTGQLDMIPVIFHTDERAKFMNFSTPYVAVPTSVFVPVGGGFTLSGLEDLKGRKGVMMRDDSISSEFEMFESKLNMTKVTHYAQMVEMLRNNRVDYAVVAQYGFLIQAKRMGYEHQVEMLPVPIASRNLHFAFSKKSSFVKYLPAINGKIKRMQANGKIEKMVKKAIEKAAEIK